MLNALLPVIYTVLRWQYGERWADEGLDALLTAVMKRKAKELNHA